MCCEKWRFGFGLFFLVFSVVWLCQIGSFCSPLWFQICTTNKTVLEDAGGGMVNKTVCHEYGLTQGLILGCDGSDCKVMTSVTQPEVTWAAIAIGINFVAFWTIFWYFCDCIELGSKQDEILKHVSFLLFAASEGIVCLVALLAFQRYEAEVVQLSYGYFLFVWTVPFLVILLLVNFFATIVLLFLIKNENNTKRKCRLYFRIYCKVYHFVVYN